MTEQKEEAATVKIYARIRKLMPWEKKKMSCTAEDDATVLNKTDKGTHSYTFQHTFNMEKDNRFVCDSMVMPLVAKVLEGYNTVLIAYGQTGAGKTHSLVGKPEQDIKGVLPMGLETLLQAETVTELSVSAVEAYGTHVSRIELFDLFNPVNRAQDWNEKRGNGSLAPRSATNRVVTTMQDCWDLINEAHDASHFAPTGKNPESSRGHVAFVARVKQDFGGEEQVSFFVVVDLAGSEGESAFTPDFIRKIDRPTLMARRLEAGCINTGLSQLQVVFNELKVKGKLSKVQGTGLRRILHAFINSNCHISVLFALSPAAANVGPTTSCLKFAVQCGMVKVKPIKSEKKVNMKQLVAQLQDHIAEQEHIITQLNEKVEEMNETVEELEDERDQLIDELEAAAAQAALAEANAKTIEEEHKLQHQDSEAQLAAARRSESLTTIAKQLKTFIQSKSKKKGKRHQTQNSSLPTELLSSLAAFAESHFEESDSDDDYDEQADTENSRSLSVRSAYGIRSTSGRLSMGPRVAPVVASHVSEEEIENRMDKIIKSRQSSRMDINLIQSVQTITFPAGAYTSMSTISSAANSDDEKDDHEQPRLPEHQGPTNVEMDGGGVVYSSHGGGMNYNFQSAAEGEEVTSNGVQFTHLDTTKMSPEELIDYCDELESNLIEERTLRVGYHQSQSAIISHLQETNEALLRWFQMKNIL